ncbi:MAG: CDP-diacylglycerol--glycerol-3-phosphate 3-phosphatidyltransferase [Gammaproteobacteria bacterium]|nr:CDP-diacylglycerol--glycerol-3-phosphate 3-phosphatidyltransferase [Gammaproteobacteria bacterium]MCF6230074.1 CDP-diacylglycerol--glycerol-3-phosphate 3-phosphatidyltransferase [Gammaproteobacteria bacterium]
MKEKIPNILTYGRILAIPVLVIFFYLPVEWSAFAATVVFMVAAVTDWLDGYLARRWNQTSAFGAFLDPVADKLIVAAALIILVERNPTSADSIFLALPTIVIIGREIAISALREWMAEIGESAAVAVSMIGKVKTAVQMIAITLLLYQAPIVGVSAADAGLVLLYVSAILTFYSMVIYLKAAWPILNKHDS